MNTDIYTSQHTNNLHSLRYIHIISNNVVGILNRVSSLMRRRQYNMEEVSVSFDDKNQAHIIVAIDGELLDVEQVIHQIQKLHDIKEAYDATHKQDMLFHGVYVDGKSEEDFKDFPIQAMKIIPKKDAFIAVFIVSLTEAKTFYAFLEKNKYSYIRRVMSIL